MQNGGIGDTPQNYVWHFPICPHQVSVDLGLVRALKYDLAGDPEPQQGLLFGEVRADVTEVTGYHPLPGLGRDAFAKAVQAATRPVVGYYRVREGSAFLLTSPEVSLAKDLFQQQGSVVLLIERRGTGPAEGTFFFWRGEAFVHNLPLPFPIEPVILAMTAGKRPPPILPEPPAPIPRPGLSSRVPASEPAPVRRRRSNHLGLVAALALAAVAISGAWLKLYPGVTHRAAAPAGTAGDPSNNAVITAQPGGELEITWDPKMISTATTGLLKIDDGGVPHEMSLSPDELHFGRVLYFPLSDRVRIELKTLQSDGRMVDVMASARAMPAAPPPPAMAGPGPEPAGPPPAETPAHQPTAKIVVPVPDGHPPAQAPVDPRPPLKRFTLAHADRSTSEGTVAFDPPPHEAPAAVAPASLPAALPPAVASAAPPILPAVMPKAPAPARAPVRSGRLIWTGTLLRRGLLEVDGQSVSIGSLTGALPGVPVNLTVAPADFTERGLVVYTADAARNGRVEPPSAGNGWNKISYVWDPERVREIAVLEAPNPSNRFSRLAIRSDARRCSMLMIDYSTR